MSLCRLLVLDFMDGTGRYDEAGAERYDVKDMTFGQEYALDLMLQGFKLEPFYRFDLGDFAVWCAAQILRHCLDDKFVDLERINEIS